MTTEHFRNLTYEADLDYAEQLISEQVVKAFIQRIKHHCIERNLPIELISKETNFADTKDYVIGAESLIAMGSTTEAELVLLAASFSCQEPTASISRLAEIYESKDDYQATITFTKKLLTTRGQNAEATYQLSFALYKLGRLDEALEYTLPYYACEPSQRISRLTGLILKGLGRTLEAVQVLESVTESNPTEIHSLRALVEIYTELGMYQKCLDILHTMPEQITDVTTKSHEAIIYRYMGETDLSIQKYAEIIDNSPSSIDVQWPQCFNLSIAGPSHTQALLSISQAYWADSGFLEPEVCSPKADFNAAFPRKIRIGFLTGDLGDHVVSRFLMPLLRGRKKDEVHISLLSTARRFESKANDIIAQADNVTSVQGLSVRDARSHILGERLDIIVDTNGFTANSGLQLLGQRCAPIQCHYIGYHATTGLKTIDYFLGDSITTPNSFQCQYTERLAQIPLLWMAYDSKIDFPDAASKTKRESPVFGAFSQVAKINQITLEYWAAAMIAAPDSILVIKDRGIECPTTRKRIEANLKQHGVNLDRVYFFGPVGSHLDHLDCYNAIDIAFDTTPWSGATTAFEALGMGVPLVTICGDTTSSRMSTSVVSAAGRSDWIARTPDEFARIAAVLANDYKQIRLNKPMMQKEIRAGILFDEDRICRDFYATIRSLSR